MHAQHYIRSGQVALTWRTKYELQDAWKEVRFHDKAILLYHTLAIHPPFITPVHSTTHISAKQKFSDPNTHATTGTVLSNAKAKAKDTHRAFQD